MGYEEMDDIEIAVASSPLHRRCDQVTTNSVDFGALFKKIPTCRSMSVDCCPMQWGNVLCVTVSCLSLS
ncbi:hypothetical protein M378DRAFT_163039, partial [Amanita muscaria Koide BX008]